MPTPSSAFEGQREGRAAQPLAPAPSGPRTKDALDLRHVRTARWGVGGGRECVCHRDVVRDAHRVRGGTCLFRWPASCWNPDWHPAITNASAHGCSSGPRYTFSCMLDARLRCAQLSQRMTGYHPGPRSSLTAQQSRCVRHLSRTLHLIFTLGAVTSCWTHACVASLPSYRLVTLDAGGQGGTRRGKRMECRVYCRMDACQGWDAPHRVLRVASMGPGDASSDASRDLVHCNAWGLSAQHRVSKA